MKNKINEILDKLPSNWSEVKVSDFIKLGEIDIIESADFNNQLDGIENTLQVISVFTDIPVSELEEYTYLELLPMGKKLDFMLTLPEVKKESSIKWKSISDITYNDFVVYQQVATNLYQNLHLIIPAFSVNKISAEEALEMSVEEIHTAFFLLRKDVKKYLKRMKFYLKLRLLKLQSKKILKMIYQPKLKTLKQKIGRHMDGIF